MSTRDEREQELLDRFFANANSDADRGLPLTINAFTTLVEFDDLGTMTGIDDRSKYLIATALSTLATNGSGEPLHNVEDQLLAVAFSADDAYEINALYQQMVERIIEEDLNT